MSSRSSRLAVPILIHRRRPQPVKAKAARFFRALRKRKVS